MTEHYYVTIRRGERYGYLKGPYTTHEEALAEVKDGKARAEKQDAFACFDAFGTAKYTGDNPPPSVFGK